MSSIGVPITARTRPVKGREAKPIPTLCDDLRMPAISARKPRRKPAPAKKKPAKTKTTSAAAKPSVQGIPFPFFGAGEASYFEWADLHIYFARAVKPSEKAKLKASVPPPIGDVKWDGSHLYLSSDQGVGRQIQAAYRKPPKKATTLTTTSRLKIPDGPKLSAFNADIERYLIEAHDIVPILAVYRRQDSEAGGTKLSPWHTQSIPSGRTVLKHLAPKPGAALEYMVHGIQDDLDRAKK